MIKIKKRKCRKCGVLFRPDPRNVRHQKYCSEDECRKASKAESQRRWLQKEENLDHFRGTVNVCRVQEWRAKNPGYWRKPSVSKDALQEVLNEKDQLKQVDSNALVLTALQDYLSSQPTVIIGIIAQLTGSTLQDDISIATRKLQNIGEDILSTHCKGGSYDSKVSFVPGKDSPGAETV